MTMHFLNHGFMHFKIIFKVLVFYIYGDNWAEDVNCATLLQYYLEKFA